MKKHNELVRFKNSFIADPQQQQTLATIISDKPELVLANKLSSLAQLYQRMVAQQGYNQKIAYRIITISLLSKEAGQINLQEEVKRFFTHCLAEPNVTRIGLCFELLIIPRTKEVLTAEQLRLFKIRLLRALREHYSRSRKTKDERNCRYTLREYCREALQKDYVKKDQAIYQEILDTLIEEVKGRVSGLVGRNNKIKAIEELTSFVGVLEKSDRVISSKYQFQLMEAYWALALLHHMLHYLAYTKKYASIALNIADRIQQPQAVQSLKAMIQSLS